MRMNVGLGAYYRSGYRLAERDSCTHIKRASWAHAILYNIHDNDASVRGLEIERPWPKPRKRLADDKRIYGGIGVKQDRAHTPHHTACPPILNGVPAPKKKHSKEMRERLSARAVSFMEPPHAIELLVPPVCVHWRRAEQCR